MNQANIGPHTNFDEIFTLIKCPARLYLKLAGYESEIKRRYNPPLVPPGEIGKQGEEIIASGFKRVADVSVPELVKQKFIPPKGELGKALSKIQETISVNIKAQLYRSRNVDARYRPVIISEQARKLKKEHKVAAIVGKVYFTTIPHHRTGQIDFIGVKENRDVVIIEVKNKQSKIDAKDRLQLEYYIDGLPKQYHHMRLYEHMYEVASQLFPEKYRNHLILMRVADILKEEDLNSRSIILYTILGLRIEARKKFIEVYGKTIDSDGYDEISSDQLTLDQEEADLIGACNQFLMTIPEYVELKKNLTETMKKISISSNELKYATDHITEIMEKGVREGLLVDIRRSEIVDLEKTINFDALVRKVWQVKRSVFEDHKKATKMLESCRHCNYRMTCNRIIKDEEPEESKSITSVVHKGFETMKLEVVVPKFDYVGLDENGVPKVPFRRPYAFSPINIDQLLQQALDGTEWRYNPSLARKSGWRSLYADGVVSRKLGKEFNFWDL